MDVQHREKSFHRHYQRRFLKRPEGRWLVIRDIQLLYHFGVIEFFFHTQNVENPPQGGLFPEVSHPQALLVSLRVFLENFSTQK
jgi:hypothetical protein